jgi:hypothetical protein
MPRISEIFLQTEKEFCACFTDRQKAFDRVKWTKSMQILKETGIEWQGRRLISKLYMDQNFLITAGQRGEETCEDWKKSQTSMPFVTDSIQLVQRIPYQCSS